MKDKPILKLSNIQQPNRRDFIRTGVGLTVASGITNVAASQAGADSLRVAVVGTGSRGADLIRKLSSIEEAEIVAVCDDYEPHLKRGIEYAGPKAKPFLNFEEMLERSKPQAVVIATPLHLHYKHASLALDAGCDLFCEKTMTYSLDEAQRLAQKVKDAEERVFQVGLQRRANPIYIQAKAFIDTGAIGRITSIKSQWHRNNSWRRPVPVERSDAKWAEMEKRLNWRLYRKFSHGLVTELASHQMDVANWMLNSLPKRVMGMGGIDYWRDGREVFDNIYCVYEYEIAPPSYDREPVSKDKYTVRVTYSSLCNNAYEGASELIMGTRGTILLTEQKGLLFREKIDEDLGLMRINPADKTASAITSGKTLALANDPWAHRGRPIEIDNQLGDPTRQQLISFLENVRQRQLQTICDVQIGLENTATVLMAEEAMRKGGVVNYPTGTTNQSR